MLRPNFHAIATLFFVEGLYIWPPMKFTDFGDRILIRGLTPDSVNNFCDLMENMKIMFCQNETHVRLQTVSWSDVTHLPPYGFT